MKKLRSYLAAASVRLGLPMDIAAGLPHLEVNGFRECSVDRHTGILEYNRERIVIGLNIGSLTVVGSGLEIRQMHVPEDGEYNDAYINEMMVLVPDLEQIHDRLGRELFGRE